MRLAFLAECGFPESPRDMFDTIAARNVDRSRFDVV